MSNCEIVKNGLKFNLSGDSYGPLGFTFQGCLLKQGANQSRLPITSFRVSAMSKSNNVRACDESLPTKQLTESNVTHGGAVPLEASLIRHPASDGSEQATPLRLYQAKNFLPQKPPRIQDLDTRSLRERLETENADLRNTLVNLAIELRLLRHGDEA